jgi:IS30 family transposase
MSVRDIADKAGIPKSTVHRELRDVPDGTPVPDAVKGHDGKRYKARRQERRDAERAARRDIIQATTVPLSASELVAIAPWRICLRTSAT